MTYTVARGYPAVAEVVFHLATDPGRVTRWLPSGVTAEKVGTGQARISWPGGTDVVDWDVDTETLGVTVRSRGRAGCSARLRVYDEPAGASTARLEVEGDDGRLRAAAE